MKCAECNREAHAKGLCAMHYKRATSQRAVHPTRGMTIDERFDHYVRKTDACWVWAGASFGDGKYGAFWDGKKTIGAHVYAFKRSGGAVAKGIYVCHSCDNPLCVNPGHLFAGTPKDNTDDMMRKSRGVWPRGGEHHLAKLSDEAIEEILQLKETMTQAAIAKRFGVDPSHISRIVRGHKRGRVQVAPLT